MPSKLNDPHMSTAPPAAQSVPMNFINNRTPSAKQPVTATTHGKSDIQRRFEEICFKSPLPRSISQIYNSFQLPGSLAPPPPAPPPPLFPSAVAQPPQPVAGKPIACLRRQEPENDHSSEESTLKSGVFLPQSAAIGPAKVTDEVKQCVGGLGGLRMSHTYYPTGTLALGTGVHRNVLEATGNHLVPTGHGTIKNGERSLQVEDTRMESQKTLKHVPSSRVAIATATESPTTIANAQCIIDSTPTKPSIYQPDLGVRPVSPLRKGEGPVGESRWSRTKRRKLSQLLGIANAPVIMVPQMQTQKVKEKEDPGKTQGRGARGVVLEPKQRKEKLQEQTNQERTEPLVGKEGEVQGRERDLIEETSPVFNSEQGQESEKTVQEQQIAEVENDDSQDRDCEESGAGSVTNGMVKEISAAKKDQLPQSSPPSILSQSRRTRRSLSTKLTNSTASKPPISLNSPEVRGDAQNATPPSWVKPVRAKMELVPTHEQSTPRLRLTRGNKTPAKPQLTLTPKSLPTIKALHHSSSPERSPILIDGRRRSSYRVSKAPREWWIVGVASALNTGLPKKTGSVERRARMRSSLVGQQGAEKAELLGSVGNTGEGKSEAHESQAKENKQVIQNGGKESGVGNAKMEARQRSTSRGVARQEPQSLSTPVSSAVQPHVQSQLPSPIAPHPTYSGQQQRARDFNLDDKAESQLQMELTHSCQEDNPLRSRSPPPLTHMPSTTPSMPKQTPKKPSKISPQIRPKSVLGKVRPPPPTAKGMRHNPTSRAGRGKRANENASASVVHGSNRMPTRRTKHEVEHADYEFSD